MLPANSTSGDSLPALLHRAGQRLLDAQSSGEVLEAKRLADAALHLAKIVNASKDTQADCLRIIARAEMRMADEIDAGQERGELATVNTGGANIPNGVRSSDTVPATLDDIGVTRQRLAEWRDMRDAGEQVVEGAIQDALTDGRAPTKADIKRSVEAFRESLPSKSEANKIALQLKEQTGGTHAVLGRDGKYHSGATDNEVQLGDLYLKMAAALRAVIALNETPANELIGTVSAQSALLFPALLGRAEHVISNLKRAWSKSHEEGSTDGIKKQAEEPAGKQVA